MKKIKYEVLKNGIKFFTTNYEKATEKGSRIIKAHMVEIDETSEAEKEWMKKRVEKINNS